MTRLRTPAAASAVSPAQSPAVLFAFAWLAVLVGLHSLALSAFTSNLDDVKHLTLWIGGASCLVAWLGLAAFGRTRLPSRAAIALWTATLAAMAASSFSAEPHAQWIAWQGVRTHVCMLGWFLLSFAMLARPATARWAIAAWIATALLTVFFGLFHYAGGMETIRHALERAYEARQAAGLPVGQSRFYTLVVTFAESREMLSTALNTQFYCVFLSFAFPVGLAGALLGFREWRSGGGRRALALAAGGALLTVLAPTCMVLTSSKAAWGLVPLGVLAFALATHFLLGIRVVRLPMWPVALGLGAAVFATALWFGRADIVARMNTMDTSIGSRAILGRAAIAMFREHPLLGVGPRAYIIEAPQYRSPNYHMNAISNIAESAHNWVLDQLAETGLAGTLPWIALNLIAFVRAMMGAARRDADPVLRYAAAGFGVGLLLFLAGNFFASMYRWPLGLVQHAVALGMALGAGEAALRGGESAEPAAPSAARSAILSLAGVAALAFFIYQSSFAVGHFAASMANQDGLEAAFLSPEVERSRTPQAFAFREKSLRSAAEHFQRAVDLEPTFLTSRYKLASVLNRLGALAREKYLVLLSADKGAPRREESLRELLRESIDWNQKTFDAYDELGTYSPDYAEIHYNRVVLHYSVGRDCLQAATDLDLEPGERDHFVAEARHHFALGTKAAERACALSSKITVHTLAADLHAVAATSWPDGSPERAEEFRRAGSRYEHASALPLTTAIQYAGQTAVEREELLKAARRAPDMFFRAGDWDRAAAMFEGLIARWPGDGDLYRRAVDCWVRAEKPSEALRVIDAGLVRNPIAADLRLLRAEVLLHGAETAEHHRAVMLEVMTIEELDLRVEGLLDDAQRKQLSELRDLAGREL